MDATHFVVVVAVAALVKSKTPLVITPHENFGSHTLDDLALRIVFIGVAHRVEGYAAMGVERHIGRVFFRPRIFAIADIGELTDGYRDRFNGTYQTESPCIGRIVHGFFFSGGVVAVGGVFRAASASGEREQRRHCNE